MRVFVFWIFFSRNKCFLEKTLRIYEKPTEEIFNFPQEILVLRYTFYDLIKKYYKFKIYEILEDVIITKFDEPKRTFHFNILRNQSIHLVKIEEIRKQLMEDLDYMISKYKMMIFDEEFEIIKDIECKNIQISLNDLIYFENIQIDKVRTISEKICESNEEFLIEENINLLLNSLEDDIVLSLISSIFCSRLTKLAAAKVVEFNTSILDPFNIENIFENRQIKIYNYIDCILNDKFAVGFNSNTIIIQILQNLSFDIFEIEEIYLQHFYKNLRFLEDFNHKDYRSQKKFINEIDGDDKAPKLKLGDFLKNKISILFSFFEESYKYYETAKNKISYLLDGIESIYLKRFLALFIKDCELFMDITKSNIKNCKKVENIVNKNIFHDLSISFETDYFFRKKININIEDLRLDCENIYWRLKSLCGYWELLHSKTIQNNI